MPPLTKAEQSSAKGWRKSRLAVLAWLLGAILFWGALGLLWLQGSTTCALGSTSALGRPWGGSFTL
jgi:hypothetical protein